MAEKCTLYCIETWMPWQIYKSSKHSPVWCRSGLLFFFFFNPSCFAILCLLAYSLQWCSCIKHKLRVNWDKNISPLFWVTRDLPLTKIWKHMTMIGSSWTEFWVLYSSFVVVLVIFYIGSQKLKGVNFGGKRRS